MKTSDYLSDIEQYYGMDLKSLKSHRRHQRAIWKKTTIYIGLFLAVVIMIIMLVPKNNSLFFSTKTICTKC